MISSVVTVTNSQVLNNTASLLYGGAFYISRGGGIPTILSISNSLVQGNVAKGGKGGALQCASFDAVVLINTTFNQNIGTTDRECFFVFVSYLPDSFSLHILHYPPTCAPG
jgi:hypothetical protein